jgi:hypothetical protein
MNRTYAAISVFILLLAGCASAPLFAVVTDPAGADIFVDGKLVGKTPATIKVTFTENSQMVMEKKILIVKLSGYKEKKEVISYNKGNTALKFQLAPDHVESVLSAAEAIGKSSATTGLEKQAGIKAEVISKQSATTGP